LEEHGPWKTLKTTVAYDSPWIEVTHSEVLNPANNLGQYGVVHFKNLAIGILPLDADYNTWLIGQYRYPLKQYSWEIPEGGGDPNIDPLESAKRELLEEAGIKAARWTKIQELHLSNSATDEFSIIYAAQDLTFHEPEPEEDEELEIKKVSFDEFYDMVDRAEITDSLSVVAALKGKIMIKEGQL
jgi:ADP-ribose pyrophosphatase